MIYASCQVCLAGKGKDEPTQDFPAVVCNLKFVFFTWKIAYSSGKREDRKKESGKKGQVNEKRKLMVI